MPSDHLKLVGLGPDEAPVAAGFIAVCGEHIHRTAGLDHWYPVTQLDALVERLGHNDLFGVHSGDLLVAAFGLSVDPLPYYGDLAQFRLPMSHPHYLSAMAVLPSHQGCGVGRFAMDQAERIVVDRGGDGIRLDAVTTNTPAMDFYRRLGYSEGGVIAVGHLTVTCFERQLG